MAKIELIKFATSQKIQHSTADPKIQSGKNTNQCCFEVKKSTEENVGTEWEFGKKTEFLQN